MGGKLSTGSNHSGSSATTITFQQDNIGNRMVLLGNTSSGKTTICEMIQHHQHVVDNKSIDRGWYKVDTNTISKIIIEQVLYSSKETSPIESIIMEHISNGGNYDDSALISLWNDERFRTIYRTNQDILNLFENVDIFVSKLVNHEKFIPDIYIKGGSSGIIDYDIMFNENKMIKFVTAGGKTYERRKWRYCLENVSVLIYVVSLSEFNQTCYGDENINRMDESLKLYKELIDKFTNTTRVILLFTKPDIMMKKLRNFVEFNRSFTIQSLPELSQVVNDYHERDVVNTIISSYLKIENNGIKPEYHILRSISDFDISQVVKLVVNDNEKNFHFLSNCLFEKTTLKRLHQSMLAQQLTDLLIHFQ